MFLLKKSQFIAISLLCLACFFAFEKNGKAQTIEVQIEISAASASNVSLKGKFSPTQKNLNRENGQTRWIFENVYADAQNLAARLSNLEFFDENKKPLSFNKIGVGEFETAKTAAFWSYEVNLALREKVNASPHVSWIDEERGLLHLADLLPQMENVETARISLKLPAGWKTASGENKSRDNEFVVKNVENAVFLVGKNFKEQSGTKEKTAVRLAIDGNWAFSDAEAHDLGSRIFAEYARDFGEINSQPVQLLLLAVPNNSNSNRWRAETRGSNVILLASPTPFKSIALNRLHEQLRHELFHLWIPNRLNLSGHYEWFYEGFTLYQALKTGVKMKYIRFEDFLDALSRALDAAKFGQNGQKLSLLDASKEFWRGNDNFVYAKGMIVAFLCDVALLSESGGKQSLTEVFQEVLRGHKSESPRADANSSLLSILKKRPRLIPIAAQFIEGMREIDAGGGISESGLRNISETTFTKFAIAEKLNGRQKKILGKLGYSPESNSGKTR